MKAKLGTKALSITLTFAMSSLLPGVAIGASVNPQLIDWQSGNAGEECARLSAVTGTPYVYALKYNEAGGEEGRNGSETYTNPDGHTNTITISNSDNKTFDFSATKPIGAVIVKAGTQANIYSYNPQKASDTRLSAPLAQNSSIRDISHVTLCWNPEVPPPTAQWCSPGYWRQVQHYGSWPISRDTLYSTYFAPITLTKKGVADGATTNPTLIQVLNSPQWYGGDSFNLVADKLSQLSPDVNFNGTRVEDSCPLGRAE